MSAGHPPGSHGGAAPDPRAGRFGALTSALRVTQLAVALLAATAIVVGSGPAAAVLGAAALGALVAAGPVRVAWLAQRWLRRGDRLYGSLAVLLVVLPVLGLVVSILL